MSIESAADMGGLRDVGRITGLTLDALEKHVAVGVTTAELDEVAARLFAEHGDLVKLDVTAEKNGYIADAARSVVVSPESDTARRLVLCARAAFEAALAVARAGNRVNEIGRAVDREVRRHGFTVLRELTGHGVGRTIHEEPAVPNFFDRSQRDVLTEGLVLTIEPLISAGSSKSVQDADGWTIRTRDGSLAAHHEHTLVITRQDPLILTAA
jgi:methionyl aminopeptidase